MTAVCIRLIVWGIVLPIFEEIVFRFGVLLQALLRLRRNKTLAIIGSAAAFGAAHLGGLFYGTSDVYRTASSTFVFGIVAGVITVHYGGRLAPP